MPTKAIISCGGGGLAMSTSSVCKRNDRNDDAYLDSFSSYKNMNKMNVVSVHHPSASNFSHIPSSYSSSGAHTAFLPIPPPNDPIDYTSHAPTSSNPSNIISSNSHNFSISGFNSNTANGIRVGGSNSQPQQNHNHPSAMYGRGIGGNTMSQIKISLGSSFPSYPASFAAPPPVVTTGAQKTMAVQNIGSCLYQKQANQSLHSCYKMSLCNFYKKGRCRNGATCRFAHGLSELRGPLPKKQPGKKKKKKKNDLGDSSDVNNTSLIDKTNEIVNLFESALIHEGILIGGKGSVDGDGNHDNREGVLSANGSSVNSIQEVMISLQNLINKNNKAISKNEVSYATTERRRGTLSNSGGGVTTICDDILLSQNSSCTPPKSLSSVNLSNCNLNENNGKNIKVNDSISTILNAFLQLAVQQQQQRIKNGTDSVKNVNDNYLCSVNSNLISNGRLDEDTNDMTHFIKDGCNDNNALNSHSNNEMNDNTEGASSSSASMDMLSLLNCILSRGGIGDEVLTNKYGLQLMNIVNSLDQQCVKNDTEEVTDENDSDEDGYEYDDNEGGEYIEIENNRGKSINTKNDETSIFNSYNLNGCHSQSTARHIVNNNNGIGRGSTITNDTNMLHNNRNVSKNCSYFINNSNIDLSKMNNNCYNEVAPKLLNEYFKGNNGGVLFNGDSHGDFLNRKNINNITQPFFSTDHLELLKKSACSVSHVSHQSKGEEENTLGGDLKGLYVHSRSSTPLIVDESSPVNTRTSTPNPISAAKLAPFETQIQSQQQYLSAYKNIELKEDNKLKGRVSSVNGDDMLLSSYVTQTRTSTPIPSLDNNEIIQTACLNSSSSFLESLISMTNHMNSNFYNHNNVDYDSKNGSFFNNFNNNIINNNNRADAESTESNLFSHLYNKVDEYDGTHYQSVSLSSSNCSQTVSPFSSLDRLNIQSGYASMSLSNSSSPIVAIDNRNRGGGINMIQNSTVSHASPPPCSPSGSIVYTNGNEQNNKQLNIPYSFTSSFSTSTFLSNTAAPSSTVSNLKNDFSTSLPQNSFNHLLLESSNKGNGMSFHDSAILKVFDEEYDEQRTAITKVLSKAMENECNEVNNFFVPTRADTYGEAGGGKEKGTARVQRTSELLFENERKNTFSLNEFVANGSNNYSKCFNDIVSNAHNNFFSILSVPPPPPKIVTTSASFPSIPSLEEQQFSEGTRSGLSPMKSPGFTLVGSTFPTSEENDKGEFHSKKCASSSVTDTTENLDWFYKNKTSNNIYYENLNFNNASGNKLANYSNMQKKNCESKKYLNEKERLKNNAVRKVSNDLLISSVDARTRHIPPSGVFRNNI